MPCEQTTETAETGEAYLEAGLRDVVTPPRQKRLRPLYAQAGQKLVRRLTVGPLVNTQEVVGGEVRVSRDIGQRDRTPVSVTHTVPGLSETPVRLRVHKKRVQDAVRKPRALWTGARVLLAGIEVPIPI